MKLPENLMLELPTIKEKFPSEGKQKKKKRNTIQAFIHTSYEKLFVSLKIHGSYVCTVSKL